MGDLIEMTWPQYLRRRCRYYGRTLRLGSCEVEILLTLLLRRGTIVPVGEIVESVYPDANAEPDWAEANVRVRVHYLRRKLPGVIQGEWGRGYTIDLPAQLARAA